MKGIAVKMTTKIGLMFLGAMLMVLAGIALMVTIFLGAAFVFGAWAWVFGSVYSGAVVAAALGITVIAGFITVLLCWALTAVANKLNLIHYADEVRKQ